MIYIKVFEIKIDAIEIKIHNKIFFSVITSNAVKKIEINKEYK